MHKLGGKGCFYFFGQKWTVNCCNKELIKAALSNGTSAWREMSASLCMALIQSQQILTE